MKIVACVFHARYMCLEYSQLLSTFHQHLSRGQRQGHPTASHFLPCLHLSSLAAGGGGGGDSTSIQRREHGEGEGGMLEEEEEEEEEEKGEEEVEEGHNSSDMDMDDSDDERATIPRQER